MGQEKLGNGGLGRALVAGWAVWTATGFVAFIIYGSTASGTRGANAGLAAGAFLLIPLALGVTTTVSMMRSSRRALADARRKQSDAMAEARAHQARVAEAARQNELARRERERIERTREEERRQVKLVEDARESVSLIVRNFNDLPVRLGEAVAARDQAKKHFEAGAYSPFWSAIEESLAELSHFRANVDAIRLSVNDYHRHLESLHALPGAGAPAAVPELPGGLEVLAQTSAAQSIAASVQSLTYEAQKDPVFAQIWEQRRITAATIEGFATIEAAMSGMSNRISASIDQLQGTIVGVGLGLAAEIRTSRRETERQTRNADQRASDASELLSSAVYYLREANAREGGTGDALWDRGRI